MGRAAKQRKQRKQQQQQNQLKLTADLSESVNLPHTEISDKASDLNQVQEINPQDARAYCERGIAYIL